METFARLRCPFPGLRELQAPPQQHHHTCNLQHEYIQFPQRCYPILAEEARCHILEFRAKQWYREQYNESTSKTVNVSIFVTIVVAIFSMRYVCIQTGGVKILQTKG